MFIAKPHVQNKPNGAYYDLTSVAGVKLINEVGPGKTAHPEGFKPAALKQVPSIKMSR